MLIYIVPADILNNNTVDFNCPIEGPLRLTIYPSYLISVGDQNNDNYCRAGAYLYSGDIDMFGDPILVLCEAQELDVDANGYCSHGEFGSYDFGPSLTDVDLSVGCVTGDAISGSLYCSCLEEECQLDIPMPYAGWHMISSHCSPDPDSITQVFAPIVNDIIQVKNLTGQVYVPSFNNFNTLTTWDVTQGYLVKTNAAVTLPISGGLPVNLFTDQIPLYTGWNMIAYWLQGSTDPIDVFSDISNDVIQVKDLGGSYVPSFNDFNNMGNMNETRGYQVKMIQGNNLQYDFFTVFPRPASGASNDDERLQPVHFTKEIKPNPNTSTLLVIDDENNKMNYGDELGIFTPKGLLVGSFIYKNDMMGGLIFGDDETEEGIDGILNNETYIFKVWDKLKNEEREVEMNFIQGNTSYQKDDLCAVAFKASESVGINQIDGLDVNIMPNPASTYIAIELEIDNSDIYNIEIFNASGKLVSILENQLLSSGNNQIRYNVEDLSTGLYLIRLVSKRQFYSKRLSIVR